MSNKKVYVAALSVAVALLSAQTLTHDHGTASNRGQLGLHAHTASVSSQLPISVNGAETPQLIPDDLAYRHFILSVAEHSAASSVELDRRASRLRLTGLSQSDQRALVLAVAELREKLDAIEATRLATASSNASALQQLLNEETTLLDNARAVMLATLSPQGVAIMDSYVQNNVKKGIVIYASN